MQITFLYNWVMDKTNLMRTCLYPAFCCSLILGFNRVERLEAEGRGPLGAVGEDRQQGREREVNAAAVVSVAARLKLVGTG